MDIEQTSGEALNRLCSVDCCAPDSCAGRSAQPASAALFTLAPLNSKHLGWRHELRAMQGTLICRRHTAVFCSASGIPNKGTPLSYTTARLKLASLGHIDRAGQPRETHRGPDEALHVDAVALRGQRPQRRRLRAASRREELGHLVLNSLWRRTCKASNFL